MKHLPRPLLFALLLALVSYGCRRKFSNPSWDTQVLTPLLKTSLTIRDIVNDTLMQTESDSSITLVYRTSLYKSSIDSLVTIDINSFTTSVTLDSLRLAPQTISHDISLGTLASASGPQGQAINDFNGTTTPVPPITGMSAGPVQVDATQFFESATLLEGWMDLSAYNGYPIAVTNTTFEIRNNLSGSLVATGTFPQVQPGATETITVDLAGASIESVLDVFVTNLDIPGSVTPVLIDTSDIVTTTMTVYGLRVESATAIFPAQEVLNHEEVTPLQNLDDVGIKFATLKSGFVQAEVISTSQDTVFFHYEIPGAVKDGIPFSIDTKVPPAPPGDTTHVYFTQDCAGYDFDFSGEPGQDTVNAYYSILTGRIDSTGQLVYMSLLDSAYVNLTVNDLLPSYVRGYMGSKDFEFGPATAELDVFKRIESGTLDFSEARIGVTINNGLGISGEVNISSLTAENSKTGSTVPLDLSGLNLPIAVAKATDNPLTPAETYIELNTQNSNPTELLAILPDRFHFDLAVQTNPQGNTGTYDDFAYEDFNLEATLDIELPMHMMATNLTLADTVEFLSGSIETPEQIEEGTLHILVDNGFPLSTELEVVFLDDQDNEVLTLDNAQTVEAATVNSAGRVTEKQSSRLDFELTKTMVQQMIEASKVVYRVVFNTKPSGTHVRVYSEYGIDFQLTGDFIYRAQ